MEIRRAGAMEILMPQGIGISAGRKRKRAMISLFVLSMFAVVEARAPDLAFIKALARLRAGATGYLMHGAFVRPPEIDLPEIEIPISRLSIYAGQQDAVQEYTKRVPPVLACTWRDADGNIAVPIVNITDEPMKIHIQLSTEIHGLPEKGVAYKRLPDSRAELMRFENSAVTVSDTLDAAGAYIYEFEGSV